MSHRRNSCLWIILTSNYTIIILVFDCIFLSQVFSSAPFAFPCEAIVVFMLLLTTTCTVVISTTGFLPKPEYSQPTSEQALRDSSKLGGISRMAVFSVLLKTHSLSDWEAAQQTREKGEGSWSRRIACLELLRKMYLFAKRFWRSRNASFFSKIIL